MSEQWLELHNQERHGPVTCGCHCGEFDRRTIAPDEFGETMIHDLDKCAVPLVKVSDETTIRLLRVRLEYVEADLRVAKDRLAVAEKSWRTWQDIAVRWRQRFNRRNADADALRERVTALNAEVHRLRSTSVRGDA